MAEVGAAWQNGSASRMMRAMKEAVQKMNVEIKKPIHYLKTNPKNWMGASLPKFKTSAQEVMSQTPLSVKELMSMPWSQRHDYLNSYAIKKQERRWEDEVGLKPEDSHFTLIVPIYNEAKSLPSFLRTLLLSDIPSSVNVNVVLITNACNNSSSVLIDDFLSILGELEIKSLAGVFKDNSLNLNYKTSKLGSITFMHVDTRTPGKANALGIGNSIARESSHTIAMSLDANNYLEPDAIRVMFAHALKAFRGKPRANDTVLLYGKIQRELTRASLAANLMIKGNKTQQLVVNTSDEVAGWFMAWNAEWIYSIGGPPAVAAEDYAMKVLAKVNSYKIERVDGAPIWGYEVTNLKDMLDTRARYIRGKLQLLDLVNHDTRVLKIIEQEGYYMRNFLGRMEYLLSKIKERPLILPKHVAAFLLWEHALRIGKRDYHQNPTNQSWKKINSTS